VPSSGIVRVSTEAERLLRYFPTFRAPSEPRKLVRTFLLVFLLAESFHVQLWPQNTAWEAEGRSLGPYREGLELLKSGKYQEALNQFRLSSELSPRKPEPLNLEGITLTLMGRVKEANQAFKQSLTLDNGFWMARRGLAANYLRAGQVDAAVVELRQVLKVAPTDSAANLLLGQISFIRKDCASALLRFGRAAELVQRETQASLMEAECQIETGQTTAAQGTLRKLGADTALEPRYRFKIGWLFGRMGSFEEAMQLFESLPENYPNPLSRGYAVALAHFQLRQYAECIQVLERLKSQNIEDSDLFALLGVAYDRLGKPLDAYSAFLDGIRANPKSEKNYLNLAALSAHLGKWDFAVQSVTGGIEQLPGAYRLYLCRGLLYQKQGQAQSEQDYRRAIDLAPKSPEPYEALALSQIEGGRSKAALKVLRDANHVASKDPGNYYLQAEALVRIGAPPDSPNYHEALEALNACLALDKEFIYAYYDRGKLKLKARDVEGSIRDLERARALRPQATDVLYKLAQAYQRAGRTREATELFDLRQGIGNKELDDYNQFMLNTLAGDHKEPK
jgi:tetratricopeptide (TPR) repeat protein